MSRILSIIVPAYNMEKYLDRCLSSLIVDEEQMNLFEVLVINDGSKDHTSDIAHKFMRDYPGTFYVIDKENGHYGSCVNAGLKCATGTFIKILDADDCFDNAVFAQFLNFLCRPDVAENADLVICDYKEVDNDLNTLQARKFPERSESFTVCGLTAGEKGMWFIHMLTYRRLLLKNINYQQTEGIAYTDHEWAFIPMAYVRCIYKFSSVLYNYVIGRSGQSVDEVQHAKNIWMEFEVANNLISFFAEKDAVMPEQNHDFMQERLLITVNNLYQLQLLTFSRYNKDLSCLQRMDAQLKEKLPALYNRSEKYSTRIANIAFHPVKQWRQGGLERVRWIQLFYNLCNAINHLTRRS